MGADLKKPLEASDLADLLLFALEAGKLSIIDAREYATGRRANNKRPSDQILFNVSTPVLFSVTDPGNATYVVGAFTVPVEVFRQWEEEKEQ